jgi:GMP synthase (glutamine-hydrolysing)
MRHPFSGPALSLRVMGEVTLERLDIARAADVIVMAEIRASGLYDEVSQALVAITQDRALGCQGDKRVYGYLAIVRAVKTTDFMSAEP